MDFGKLYNHPPDAIVDVHKRILVGPVVIFYERNAEGRFVCIKLSNYLSPDKLKEYGLDKGNPSFHELLEVYRKKTRLVLTERLVLFDVYVEYIPHCVLSSVFEEKDVRKICNCKLKMSYTGSPVIIDEDKIDELKGEKIKFGITCKDSHKITLIEPNDPNKWLQNFMI